MIASQVKHDHDPIEFTFPRQVWESFSTLKRGVGCEFLTTNLTKMSVHKISLFKYLDDGVRVKLTVSSILEAAIDQPEYIKIEDMHLSHNLPSQPDTQEDTVMNDSCDISAGTQVNSNTVEEFRAFVTHNSDAEENDDDCAPMELVFDSQAEIEDNVTGTKSDDCTLTESGHILQELEKPHEISAVNDALETLRSNNPQRLSETNISEEDSYKEQPIPHLPNTKKSIANVKAHDNSLLSVQKDLVKSENSASGKHRSMINQCSICKRTFKSKLQAARHMNKEHRESSVTATQELAERLKDPRQQCNVCGNLYANAYVLRAHMEVMHTPHVQAECAECGMKVKNEKALAGHMKRIHEQQEKKYLCHLCPASFRVQNYLNGHMKAVHPDTPKDAFSCDLCDFKSAYEKYVRLHKARVHGAKRFQCEICEQKFSSGSNLKRHMETLHPSLQLPLSRYVCQQCKKTFSTKGNLKLHKLRAHQRSMQGTLTANQTTLLKSKRNAHTHTEVESSKSVLERALDGYILFNQQPS